MTDLESITQAATKARAVLGDRVRDGSASDEEREAYEELCDALQGTDSRPDLAQG